MTMFRDICSVLCKSSKFETGQGTCAARCMEQLGSARRDCQFVEQVHGNLATSICDVVVEHSKKVSDSNNDVGEGQRSDGTSR